MPYQLTRWSTVAIFFFRHPRYPDVDNNILIRLARMDPDTTHTDVQPRYGVFYSVTLLAYQVIAGNAFDGYLEDSQHRRVAASDAGCRRDSSPVRGRILLIYQAPPIARRFIDTFTGEHPSHFLFAQVLIQKFMLWYWVMRASGLRAEMPELEDNPENRVPEVIIEAFFLTSHAYEQFHQTNLLTERMHPSQLTHHIFRSLDRNAGSL